MPPVALKVCLLTLTSLEFPFTNLIVLDASFPSILMIIFTYIYTAYQHHLTLVRSRFDYVKATKPCWKYLLRLHLHAEYLCLLYCPCNGVQVRAAPLECGDVAASSIMTVGLSSAPPAYIQQPQTEAGQRRRESKQRRGGHRTLQLDTKVCENFTIFHV